MFKTAKGLAGLAAISAALSGIIYWWWGHLIVGTFSQCVGGSPASGVDCAHAPQIYAAIVFAALSAILLLAAVIRLALGRKPARRVA
jgi:hypothetical protein